MVVYSAKQAAGVGWGGAEVAQIRLAIGRLEAPNAGVHMQAGWNEGWGGP